MCKLITYTQYKCEARAPSKSVLCVREWPIDRAMQAGWKNCLCGRVQRHRLNDAPVEATCTNCSRLRRERAGGRMALPVVGEMVGAEATAPAALLNAKGWGRADEDEEMAGFDDIEVDDNHDDDGGGVGEDEAEDEDGNPSRAQTPRAEPDQQRQSLAARNQVPTRDQLMRQEWESSKRVMLDEISKMSDGERKDQKISDYRWHEQQEWERVARVAAWDLSSSGGISDAVRSQLVAAGEARRERPKERDRRAEKQRAKEREAARKAGRGRQAAEATEVEMTDAETREVETSEPQRQAQAEAEEQAEAETDRPTRLKYHLRPRSGK